MPMFPLLISSMRLGTSRIAFFPYTTLFRSRGVERRAGPVSAPTPPHVGSCHANLATRDWHGSSQHEVVWRSEEHTSELQSRLHLVCRLLLEKKKRRREAVFPCFRGSRLRFQ